MLDEPDRLRELRRLPVDPRSRHRVEHRVDQRRLAAPALRAQGRVVRQVAAARDDRGLEREHRILLRVFVRALEARFPPRAAAGHVREVVAGIALVRRREEHRRRRDAFARLRALWLTAGHRHPEPLTLDGERLEIVRALGLTPLRFVDIFHGAGLTTTGARDSGSSYQAIHESEPNFTIKSPPSLDHRYIKEDVGYGLVPMAEIGKLLGIETPVMDALITLASVALGIDFRVEGLTLEKMGLAGVAPADLQRILTDGF